MINVENLFDVMKRIEKVYYGCREISYEVLMGTYAEIMAIEKMRYSRFEENKVTKYFLEKIGRYKWDIAKILASPSTTSYSIYNHGYPKTRSRNDIHTINFFDMDDFVENILSAGDEPSPWPAVDDTEGIFNKHFVGVLKEIDDEFDETELLTYKASYFKLKYNKENYNWNKR